MSHRRPDPQLAVLHELASSVFDDFDPTYPYVWQDGAVVIDDREHEVSTRTETVIDGLEQLTFEPEFPRQPFLDGLRDDVIELAGVTTAGEPAERRLIAQMHALLDWAGNVASGLRSSNVPALAIIGSLGQMDGDDNLRGTAEKTRPPEPPPAFIRLMLRMLRRRLPSQVMTVRASATFILDRFAPTHPPLWADAAIDLGEREAEVSGSVDLIVETLEQWSAARVFPEEHACALCQAEIENLARIVTDAETAERELVKRVSLLLAWIDG